MLDYCHISPQDYTSSFGWQYHDLEDDLFTHVVVFNPNIHMFFDDNTVSQVGIHEIILVR